MILPIKKEVNKKIGCNHDKLSGRKLEIEIKKKEEEQRETNEIMEQNVLVKLCFIFVHVQSLENCRHFQKSIKKNTQNEITSNKYQHTLY